MCSALSLQLCGVERTMHRPTAPAGAPVLPSRGAIKGNWDMKTTRRTTTWLVARAETGLKASGC